MMMPAIERGDGHLRQPQPALPRITLCPSGGNLCQKRLVLGIAGIEQRAGQIQVAVCERSGRVVVLRFSQQGAGPLVGIPQRQRFLATVQRAGVQRIVAGGPRLLHILIRVRRQREAFRVRLVKSYRFLEFLDGLVAVLLLRGHRFEGDFFQFAFVADRVDAVLRRGQQALHHVATRMGRLPADDFVQNGAQQIHVAGLVNGFERAAWPFPAPCTPACRPWLSA